MKLLGIIAYIEDVAETLQSAKGVGLLVKILKKTTDLINDQVKVNVLEAATGVIKMLGTIFAKTSEPLSALVQNDGPKVRKKCCFSSLAFLQNICN